MVLSFFLSGCPWYQRLLFLTLVKYVYHKFKHVNVAHFYQVEAFSLEEPVHLEPQTTPQEECLLLERDQQLLLPPQPTPPSHPSQDRLEVDSTFHNPPHSIWGMLHFLSLQYVTKFSESHTVAVLLLEMFNKWSMFSVYFRNSGNSLKYILSNVHLTRV